jgi:hypothetical protein
MRGSGLTGGNITTSQSGQQEGRNKRQRCNKSRRRRQTRSIRETHLFCGFVPTQRVRRVGWGECQRHEIFVSS